MTTPQLDHIVIHVPLDVVQNPPVWLTDVFTISPGGTHGDGKTTNKLVVFADGTYLELIAFTKPEARDGHWWGDKGYGIVDYALTFPSSETYTTVLEPKLQTLQSGLPSGLGGLVPDSLRQGSRLTPSGDLIEWHVAFPQASKRGGAPFWCFDRTPREKRVPIDAKATTHPSGALGVGSLTLFTTGEATPEKHALVKVLDTCVPGNEARIDSSSWELDTPRQVKEFHVQSQLFVVTAQPGSAELEALTTKGRNIVAKLSLFTGPGAPDQGRITQQIGSEGDELCIGFTANV